MRPSPTCRQPIRTEACSSGRALRFVFLAALSGTVLLLLGCGGAGQRAVLGNLRMNVPTNWHVRHVQESCANFGSGILLADLAQRRLSAIKHKKLAGLPSGSCTTGWDLSRLGAKYALVSIDAGVLPFRVSPSRFPLAPRGFHVASDTCQCSARSGPISAGSKTYFFRMWLGEHASAIEREQLADLVRSIALVRGG